MLMDSDMLFMNVLTTHPTYTSIARVPIDMRRETAHPTYDGAVISSGRGSGTNHCNQKNKNIGGYVRDLRRYVKSLAVQKIV